MQIELTFKFQKETPGAVQYKEVKSDDGSVVVGTLYLRKSALPNGIPQTVHVQLETTTE